MFMNGHGKQINDYSVNIFQLNWKYRHTDLIYMWYICAFRRLSVQDYAYVKIPNHLKHLQFNSYMYTISLMLSLNLLLLDQLKFLLNAFILILYQIVFHSLCCRFIQANKMSPLQTEKWKEGDIAESFRAVCGTSYLLAHLSRRLTRWAYSIPVVCRPSGALRRHPHFQTWISLKPVGQSWSNFMLSPC